ncbi:MAG: sugar transferase [Lachnospiraceae bacterium]|nr:sugar transferase [Lachnospiraceae bacterium]
MLTSWEELPEWMKTDSVRQYYEMLDSKRIQLSLKRLFDLVVSCILFLFFSPFMLIISIAIIVDSRGGILYRQDRVTQNGKIFRIHKFRTMVANADRIGSQVTVGNDTRITRVGAFLRKYRLDELPQLIDVVFGDMTFVGTRPEAVRYVKKYTPEMLATLLLPAGITSEASIRFKDEAEMLSKGENPDEVYTMQILPIKMKYNLDSIRHFSLINDIMTMIRTLLIIL